MKISVGSDPDGPDGAFYEAAALEHMGKSNPAKVLYQELTRKFPDLPLGYLGVSRILETRGIMAAPCVGYECGWTWGLLDAHHGAGSGPLVGTPGNDAEAARWAEQVISGPPGSAQDASTGPTKAPASRATKSAWIEPGRTEFRRRSVAGRHPRAAAGFFRRCRL